MAAHRNESEIVEVEKEKDAVSVEHRSPTRSDTDREEDIFAAGMRPAAERKLVRMLDFRLLPTIILIYLMNYIDRVAITSAKLQGLTQDLHLSGMQYNTVLAILYVTYCPAQIPSNMILNRISRPSWYISGCVIAWGLVSMMSGVTTGYGGIMACRVFIGLPEAAFYPGSVYLLSRWYTRRELAFRGAIIYGGLLISNAFGGLMAAGILGGLNGKRGIAAWRWLFYIEGAISICVGIAAIFLLPDYPHNTRWLNPARRRLAQTRLAEDAGEADKDATTDSAFSGLVMALKDPKVPIMAIMNCSQLLGLGFINFFPTIAETLGYSTTITLLLTAPPWILSTIVCCLNSWNADRTGERFWHQTWPWICVIVGYIIGVTTMSTGGRYVAMFLMASGYSGFALTAVWVSNAIPRPPAKRSAAIGIVNGVGNIGNLISAFTWQVQWSPDYHPSMYIGISALAFSLVLAFVVRQMLVRQNKHLEQDEINNLTEAGRQRIEEAAKLEGLTFEEALKRKGAFRYLY